MSVVKIIRHSTADEKGRLTKEGIAQAREYSRMVQKNHPGCKIVARSSSAGRAKHTAELIMEESGADYDSSKTVDGRRRLNLSYSPAEIEKILNYKSHLEGALQEARATLYNDIINVSEFADEHAAESTNDVVYIGVTHSPTLEGLEYLVSNKESLKEKMANLEGFTIEKGYWRSDRDLDNKIPCNLAGICDEAFKKLK